MPKKKFYAVAVGRETGIFDSWEECEKRVKGFGKALYKSFPTKAGAEKFILRYRPNTIESRKRPVANAGVHEIQTKNQLKAMDKGCITTNVLDNKDFNTDTASGNTSIKEAPLKLVVHFDGGARKGAKTSAAGAGAVVEVLTPSKHKTLKIRRYLQSSSTNNFAEYSGLLEGLNQIKKELESIITKDPNTSSQRIQLIVKGDSIIVINQLNGSFQCRSDNLIKMHLDAKALIDEMKKKGVKIMLEHVYREENILADALANEAMDERRSWTTTETIERNLIKHDIDHEEKIKFSVGKNAKLKAGYDHKSGDSPDVKVKTNFQTEEENVKNSFTPGVNYDDLRTEDV